MEGQSYGELAGRYQMEIAHKDKHIAELEAALALKEKQADAYEEIVEGDLVTAKDRIKELEADNARLRDSLIKSGTWKVSQPCCVCGYYGPGYYQPEDHHCAARAKELAAELKGGE
jgi:hypothetical protein